VRRPDFITGIGGAALAPSFLLHRDVRAQQRADEVSE
jgi:hypothetical protein